MANAQATYNELMRQEEISWNMVEDLLDQQSELTDATFAEAEEGIILQQEIQEWRRAAEDAGRQMSLMEDCLKGCRPMQQITLPW